MEDRPGVADPEPAGTAAWWTLANQPRPVDARAVRVGCLLLAIVYTLLAVLRHDPAHPELAFVRGAVVLYGVLGVALGQVGFTLVRTYTVGLAILLSFAGAWVAAALGNPPVQLPLTGLSTFVAMVFLQTAFDVAVVAPTLIVLHALILLWMPPMRVAFASVIIMGGSAIATGAAASLLIVSFSARLNESVRSWREACERERAALRAKSEFLSTMSHELRSPLHVIIGYADVLTDEVPATMRQPVDRVRASAIDLLHLVENTMNASRLEAGKLTIHLETFDPTGLLDELAENLAALPEAKAGVPVHWRIPSGLPLVELDRLKLKEIVQNLVSNALKFTRQGAVTVEVAPEGSHLRLEVRDTGAGIPTVAQAKIFEMFERVETDGTHRPPGVGLGLYIVRSLVGLMHGTIDVKSEPGVGTCFTVRLPLAAPTISAAA